ncbi:peptidase M14 [Alkalilimnicola ehrlichii]|uniref:Peptidase M14 n=1 Tax=Alkalilimnicola ehrlichii TaxID=351052 RepID=A0A3E0X1C5_9GAMM|nr:M14 family metallopeptidase [Alkalilimnicola ehrlichii]RFA31277.1 peptidase M14 [Alkalilimnicola ehrlichii]RFA39449.1 peptidase M14 [Alkalilimnicola ehrlichii]
MLQIYEALPAGFVDAAPTALAALLGGPSLIHLPGRRTPALFVSVLLHGNETTGVEAVQAVLRHYRGRDLPRALSLFVGNVTAAREGLRRLDGQPDYNRIWPGGEHVDSPEARMAADVVDIMRRRGVFASIDIHNNTGLNPHYGCINRLDGQYLHLASLFSHTVVYFTRPRGVQSMAFAELCPAVTVECGQAGSAFAAEHAQEFIEAGLHLAEIPAHPSMPVGVFHTVATLKIAPDVSFGFGRCGAELELLEDLEQLNFHELPVGTALGRIGNHAGVAIVAEDNSGRDATRRFLSVDNHEIQLRRHAMPAMLTRDERVIRQDCLGYLMERLELPAS